MFNKYTSLSQAVNDLHDRGYEHEFCFSQGNLLDSATEIEYIPKDLVLAEYHRFPDDTDEDEITILFAVEAKNTTRGTFILEHSEQADMRVFTFFNKVPVKEDALRASDDN